MANIKHICFTFFLVPLEAHLFTSPAIHSQKIEWFKESFLSNKDFRNNMESQFAIRIIDIEDNLIFGKLSKKTMSHIHDLTNEDIVDVNVEDWPYLGFVCDVSENKQKFVIEYDSQFIHKVGNFSKLLSELANQRMFHYGYAVSFEPIVEERTFWNIISQSEAIYSLTFDLKSPNLFGASSAANESLKELQNVFNNNRTEITLVNDKGNLRVPEDEIETYRKYADMGGGEWKIIIKKNNKKKKYSSSDRALKIVIEAEEKADPRTLVKALRVFLNENED